MKKKLDSIEHLNTTAVHLLSHNGGKAFKVLEAEHPAFWEALFAECAKNINIKYFLPLTKIVPNFSIVKDKDIMGIMPLTDMAMRPHIRNVMSCARYQHGIGGACMGQNFYLSNPYWCTVFKGKKDTNLSTSIDLHAHPYGDSTIVSKIKNNKDRIRYLCAGNCLSGFVGKKPAILVTRIYGEYSQAVALIEALKAWCGKNGILLMAPNYPSALKNKNLSKKSIRCLPFVPQILHSKSNGSYLMPHRYSDYTGTTKYKSGSTTLYVENIKVEYYSAFTGINSIKDSDVPLSLFHRSLKGGLVVENFDPSRIIICACCGLAKPKTEITKIDDFYNLCAKCFSDMQPCKVCGKKVVVLGRYSKYVWNNVGHHLYAPVKAHYCTEHVKEFVQECALAHTAIAIKRVNCASSYSQAINIYMGPCRRPVPYLTESKIKEYIKEALAANKVSTVVRIVKGGTTPTTKANKLRLR